MAHGADEQRALAHESKRVRSALDDLADLAGGKRRRAAAPPMRSAPIAGLTPESFPVPPQPPSAPDLTFHAVKLDSRPDAPPAAPAPAANDWFGDDDALAFTGTASSGEVDFNSAPDGPEDTLGMRAGNTQEIPAALAEPSAPAAPTSEAISDVLDGFEW